MTGLTSLFGNVMVGVIVSIVGMLIMFPPLLVGFVAVSRGDNLLWAAFIMAVVYGFMCWVTGKMVDVLEDVIKHGEEVPEWQKIKRP